MEKKNTVTIRAHCTQPSVLYFDKDQFNQKQLNKLDLKSEYQCTVQGQSVDMINYRE